MLTFVDIRWLCWLLCLYGLINGVHLRAETQPRYVIWNFDEGEPLARPGTPELARLVRRHRRTTDDAHSGKGCEQILFQSSQVLPDQRLTLNLPPSRVFDELAVSLWVRANCQSLRLGVRIRFPHQMDPATGEPLSMDYFGDTYGKPAAWQQLTCRTTDERIQSRLIRLRAQLAESPRSTVPDLREMYVDQVVLGFQVPQGDSAIQLDDLKFGPIVTPQSRGPLPETVRERTPSPLSIVDDRILKRGEPFFPVFTIYHGESLDALATTGINTLWIPDYTDRYLLSALESMDLGAIAQPPQPTLEEAVLRRTGIPTFPEWTAPVWAWMLGFDVPSNDLPYVSGWASQVRDADRGSPRPILVDVEGNERAFHRNAELLGSSDFSIQTSVSVQDHLRHLRRRRDVALPGKPMFTFVQTEASSALLDYFGPAGPMPVVEPEQILHQGYAAIAAGYRGVAFWKQIPLDTSRTGLNERIHAIRIFSIHCRILEPWLATGRVIDEAPVQTDEDIARKKPKHASPLFSRWDRIVVPVAHADQGDEVHLDTTSGIRATVLRTDRGLMVLPVCYEPGSQCVPGAQTAPGIWILVRGHDEPQAWEVTPTSIDSSNLELRRVDGGTEIHLKEFDRHSAIVITRDPSAIEELKQISRRLRHDAASAYVALAELKFSRVNAVHERLRSLAPPIGETEVLLRRALFQVGEAKRELAAGHDDDARKWSQKALQNLRALQRRYWDAAVDPLPGVTTSLLATNFQTLPEHWEFLAEVGRSPGRSLNLLPSGDFEDEEALRTTWSHGSEPSSESHVQLRPGGAGKGAAHLSLSVHSAESPPLVLIGPEISTAPGTIVVITGKYRIPQPLSASSEGLLIFDTLAGRTGAVRSRRTGSHWQTFNLIRRVPEEGSLRVRVELHGPGIVDLDDFAVHALAPVP